MLGNRHRFLTVGILAGSVALLGAGFPAKTPPEKWAKSVCSALSEWGEELDTASSSFTESESRKQATAVLHDAVDATGTLVKALQKAGVPDVDGGAPTGRQLLAAFKDAQKLLKGAVKDAADLPTGGAFEDALTEIDDELGEGFDSIGQDVEKARSGADPELQAALEDEDDCAGIFADDTGTTGSEDTEPDEGSDLP